MSDALIGWLILGVGAAAVLWWWSPSPQPPLRRREPEIPEKLRRYYERSVN